MDDLLQQGIISYKAGKRDEARKIFVSVVKQNPDSESAWGWMYQTSNNDRERIYCLKQILRINPNSEKAKQKLDVLTGQDFPFESPQKTAPVIQKNKNVVSSNLILTSILVIFLICTLISIGGVYILATRKTATLPTTVVVQATTAILLPTAQPTLVPIKTTQSVLEENGFTIASRDNNGLFFFDSCGSQALWAENKPNSVSFFIPLESNICDTNGVVEPVVLSMGRLYPTSVGDWLLDTMQNNEKMTQVFFGEYVTNIVDGYKLILYLVSEENTLLFSISAPGEY